LEGAPLTIFEGIERQLAGARASESGRGRRLAMRRITLVTAICVAATTMLIAGWKFGAPAPKAVIATADAAAAANLIAPFELMVRHGKGLPAEAWDAF